MRKRVIFYFIAFILTLISFLFFGKASSQLINFSESLNRHNVVYNSFQTLSRQITKAAVLSSELANHSDTADVHIIFFTDSLSIFRQLKVLESSVMDSVNVKLVNELNSDIRAELSWILKSNVPDSMIHHGSSEHIAVFKRINSLIERGISRTGFLIVEFNERLSKAIFTVRLWMILFIIHSVILLLYTANDIYTQNFKRKQKQKELDTSHRSLEHAQRMGDENISEIKISDQARFESERKYRHLFENNPMPMWVIDRSTLRFLDVNQSALAHYGYSKSEFLAMLSVDIKSPAEKKRFKDILPSISNTPHHAGVWKHLKKDNTLIQVEIIFHDIDFGGRKACLVLITDLTEKLKSEEELKVSYQQLQDLTAHLQHVREEERTRIAREIHDELGQQLTALKIDAAWIIKRIANGDKAVTDTLSGMNLLIDDTVKAVRRISSDLRPGVLDDLGLIAAIEWQCQEFQRRTGIKSECSIRVIYYAPDRELATNIFRVYQEALTNVARHSQATNVETMLEEKESYVELIIKDNGIGFDVAESKTRKSWGLVGMKERALMFKGELLIQSNSEVGTTITLRIPIEKIELQKIALQ
jgi:PAS domain S-box-containing protein